ncbi:MAG: hypothetical protein DMF85_09980 [Acidobacteria bacterium]|nr:MAG: hypothetical protein DMF85_09980 [Acidobacteriota bacterium]
MLDEPIEVRSGQNVDGIVVTFIDAGAEIAGTVQDADGRAAPEVTVVAFPADKAYWNPQSRRVQSTRPAADGAYVLRLPPGDYLVVALADIEPGETSDPRFLQQLVPGSMKVTLGEREKKTQDIKIGR